MYDEDKGEEEQNTTAASRRTSMMGEAPLQAL